ncbi:MAG TPA: DUF3105 domain-containing protein [Candidatus Dormibacteraeota bacterium]|jgi:hypothetical protein|nr:DUF3105 domain-containing protein [Candidatus Dormibacteraeota bacterium]
MAKGKRELKQARLDERAEAIRRQAAIEARNRNLIIAAFAALVIGGFVVLYILTVNPFYHPPGFKDTSYAVADEGATHIPSTQVPTYKHQPPSSGPHYSEAGKGPIAAANYTTEQAPGGWVHNLEHGYIVLAYTCTTDCTSIHDQIQAEIANIPKESHFNEVKFLATPYQGMTAKFALLAWDRELDMPSFDATTLEGFYGKYVDHGREDLA